MSAAAAIAPTGFLAGTFLHLFLLSAVLRRRRRPLEIVLLMLLTALLLWYLGNLVSWLLRQMDASRVGTWIAAADSVALGGLVFVPALLLHTHWIYYGRYRRAVGESRVMVPATALLYLQVLGLPLAWQLLFVDPAAPALSKLGPLTTPYVWMLSLSYYLCAFVQYRIQQRSDNDVEKRLFRILMGFFVVIPVFNSYVFVWGGSGSPDWGELATVLALLASLAPTSVVAYFIYEYRFLEIPVQRSLTTAALVVLVLGLYLTGIRRLGEYLQRELAAPAILVETVFLVALLLLFTPLNRWLERRVARLFSGEIRKYRELGEAIRREGPELADSRLLAALIEQRLEQELGSGVRIHLGDEAPHGGAALQLDSGERQMGWLELEGSGQQSSGEREAMKFLAHEIALTLERCQLLESKLAAERDLARESHLADLGRMASSVAHGVKNPLSSMKTLMQLWGESGNLSEEQRREVDMMVGEVDRLSATVTRLLAFSRMGGDAKRVREVRLAPLLESLGKLYAGDLAAGGIELETFLHPTDATVRSDSDLLLEILSNLVSNAIEASSQGGRITVSIRLEDGGCRMAVGDEGTGIDPSVRERLFQPFVSAKSRGTGLGLAIVRHRVEQLGGKIRVESPLSEGRGSRFTIEL